MSGQNSKPKSLWNVLDPDDPYDIRKSMIARLPDHPPRSMSPHLELICLLQAAQIERLSDYLSELKAKYREVERRELDRHSYEVQIKELAQKNYQAAGLRTENEKLKDFIRRQTLELDELQKRPQQAAHFESLQAKYEGLLLELRLARQQREQAQKNVARLTTDIAEWRARFEKNEYERQVLVSQVETQIRERVTIEIRAVRQKAEEKNEKLQIEIKQFRDQLDNKNQEIIVLQNQKDNLSKEIRLLEERNRNKGNLEQNLADKHAQIQRINTILTERSQKLEQTLQLLQKMTGEKRILQERYLTIERERQILIQRVRQVETKRSEGLDKMQQKLAMMSMQIERLNGLCAIRSRECAQLTAELQKFKNQARSTVSLKEQLERQRQKISKYEIELQLLQSNEARVAILTQQLEKVQIMLRTKNEEIAGLQQKFRLTETSATQLAALATDKSRLEQQLQAARTELRNYRTITDSELSNLRSEQQKWRVEFQQSQAIRTDADRQRNEIVRLGRIIEEERGKFAQQKNKMIQENDMMVGDVLQLRKELQTLKVMVRQGDQREGLLHQKDQQIGNLQRLCSQLQSDIQQLESNNNRLEGSVESIYGEVERLHGVLSGKVNDIQRLTRDNSQLDEKCRFYETKFNSNAAEKEYLEKEISQLRIQVERADQLIKNERERVEQTLRVEREKWEIQIRQETQRWTRIVRQKQDIIKSKQSEQDWKRQITQQKDRYEAQIKQKDKIINEHLKQKQFLERKVIEIQRDLSIKVQNEEQLRKERDAAIQQRSQVGEKERQWEIRVVQWEGRLRDAEHGLQMSAAHNDKLIRENESLKRQNQTLRRDIDQYKMSFEQIKITSEQSKREFEQLRKRFQQDKGRGVEEVRAQLQLCEQALNRERRQCETLRTKCRNIEESTNRLIQELETTRASIKEYQLKIVHIENSNARVGQDRQREEQARLAERDTMIVTLQREVRQLENQLSTLVGRDRDALDSLNKYEDKISLLSVELERLNRVIQEKSTECNKKQNFIQDLKRQLGQIQSNNSQFSEEKYRIQITNLQTALEELENINYHTAAERDELFKISHQLKDQMDDQIRRVREQAKHQSTELQYKLEQSRRYGQELGNLKKRELLLLQKLSEAQSNQRHFVEIQNENTNLITEIHQLEMIVGELKIRLNEAERNKDQGNKQSVIFEELRAEASSWEGKYGTLFAAYEQLYGNYNLTRSEYELTLANIRTYQNKIYQFEQDFQVLSEALRAARSDGEQWKKQLYELRLREQQDGDLYQKNLVLSKEIDRLTVLSSSQFSELSELRMRITDETSLQKRIEQQLGLLVVLFAQIESLRSRLQYTERECQEVRRSSLLPCRVDRRSG